MITTLFLLATLSVAPNVDLIPGGFKPGSQPDGNTIVFRGSKGLIVVDTGRHADHTREIVDYAHAAKLPVAAIINTHWHLDHIGGNAMLRREFPAVRIYASGALAGARKGFLANYHKQLEEMVAKTGGQSLKDEIALIDAGDALMPDVVIDKSGKRDIAGRTFEIGLEKDSVTAGDLWIFDPKTRALVTGDLITVPVPFLDTACPQNWKASLDRLSKLHFDVVVPGHGDVMHRAEFEIYRTAYANFLACTENCVEGWMHDAAPLLAKEDPKFVRMLTDYYAGLRTKPCK